MQEIREQLRIVVKDLYGLIIEPDLTPSPENIDADYSTNIALKLAKELHKSPMEIASEIMNGLVSSGRVAAVEGVFKNTFEAKSKEEGSTNKISLEISHPGFLNFTLPDEYYYQRILDLSTNFRENISSDVYSGQTVICEFSDPNPFKILHVGHLYTSIVGDSIARLFEYAGAKVIRANFGGDVGLHVAKTMYALRQKPVDELTIDDIARCYIEGTALYDDDETAHQAITALNKEIYQINAEGINEQIPSPNEVPKVAEKINGQAMLSKGDPQNVLQSKKFEEKNDSRIHSESDLADLYWRGRGLSYEYFNHFYNSIGVHFDKYYPESTVVNLGLEKVKEQLKEGVYKYSEGAVVFDGEKYGLHTRVFINKEGVPTYETKDVGLIFTKWQDYHFDKSVVITGNEQLDYMKVVLKSVEQYAPDLVEKTIHLTHGLVKLPGNVKMSSRKGNILKAVDIIDMVGTELESEYHSTDSIVALAATKYAFLKYKMGGNIIFDPKESVKMTGNSGPYLLYSAVRAKKILAKVSVDELQNAQQKSTCNNEHEQTHELKSSESEHNLMKKVLEYKMVLQEAVSEMAPYKVANYLYELAQSFSRFYENCPVAGSDKETERLQLVKAYLDTMSHGLSILGIDIPEFM